MVKCLQWFLTPLSWIYAGLVWLRRSRLRRHPPQALPVPVISIGNLTVGGTGKTEMAMLVCRELLALGFKPAVLSRGYKRRSREAVQVVSRGQGLPLKLSVQAAGDEPFLLALRMPAVAVVVSQDRLAAGRMAIEELGCTVLVLDDGFQRRDQVARNLDIVLLDAADPWGGSKVLPAGYLREPLSALAEAGVLVLTRADQYATSAAFARLAVLAPGKPVLTARHAAQAVVSGTSEARESMGFLRERRVLAVAGIARPGSFVKSLEKQGAVVAGKMFFPDHYWYTLADCRRILERSRVLDAEILTTAKDAVRLAGCWPKDSRPFWVLEIQLEIMSPERGLKPYLAQACKLKEK